MTQDWAGWLLLLFSFSVVLMWKSIRDDTKVVCAIWFCLVLHHAATFVVYIPDAATFHWYGVKFAVLPRPVEGFLASPLLVYSYSLGFFYRAFGTTFLTQPVFVEGSGPAEVWVGWDEAGRLLAPGPNLHTFIHPYTSALHLDVAPDIIYEKSALTGTSFLGDELSVLAFTLSCIVLVRLVYLLDLERFRIGIVLFFGLLPSAVIFRSTTLRESWQALFFLLSVYWAIRLWKRPGILILSFMLMSAFCMALLHNALKLYAMYMISIIIYRWLVGRKKGIRCERPVRFFFVGLLVVCVIMLTQQYSEILQEIEWYMSVVQALEGANTFRLSAAAVSGRANYGVMMDTSSVLGYVKTIPMIFVHYMFAPFPWQVGNVKDVYALLESMLRFGLLFFAAYSWRRSSGEVRSYYNFLLIIYLGMEFMWAMGTVNWGTATRHHLVGYSVIVLLGAPGLILFMRKLHFVMFGRRKDNTMLPK